MPEFLTPQDMINGTFDVRSLGEAANGDDNTQVITRTGETYPSAKKAIRLMTQAGIGFTPFETKLQMTASSLPNGAYAIVSNDTVLNSGLYLKKSEVWSKVTWDVDERQKAYADNVKTEAINTAKTDATTKASDAKTQAVAIATDVASSDATFKANAAQAAAALDANTKANNAKTQAVAIATDVAFADATTKSNAAKSAAITAANTNLTQVLATQDAIAINSGKKYPLKSVPRGTNTIKSNALWSNAILDIKVLNANPALYYHLEYFANGDTSLSPDGNGWGVSVFIKDDYLADGAYVRIVNYRDATRALKTNTIDTIVLTATTGEAVIVTVDTSKLPARGTAIKSINPTHDGYADIIDPNCYIYALSPPELTTVKNDLLNLNARVAAGGSMQAALASGILSVVYASADRQYRLNFAPNGFNNLPNIVGFDYKLSTGDWVVIDTGSTDWLPPIVMTADAEPAPEGTPIYTGGNHGSSGNAGGNQTARNVYYSVKIDGKTAVAHNGACNKIEITIINELMAANTVTQGRYVMREAFKVLIVDGVITVTCERRALEALKVHYDNGIQAVSRGFDNTFLILNGQYANRQLFSEFDSGNSLDYPKAWAAVLQGNGNQLVSWMDRAYGVGNAEFVAETRPLIRRGAGTNTKLYHAAVSAKDLALVAQGSYQWRGGYHIKATAEKPTGADSQFDSMQRVIAYTANDYMIV